MSIFADGTNPALTLLRFWKDLTPPGRQLEGYIKPMDLWQYGRVGTALRFAWGYPGWSVSPVAHADKMAYFYGPCRSRHLRMDIRFMLLSDGRFTIIGDYTHTRRVALSYGTFLDYQDVASKARWLVKDSLGWSWNSQPNVDNLPHLLSRGMTSTVLLGLAHEDGWFIRPAEDQSGNPIAGPEWSLEVVKRVYEDENRKRIKRQARRERGTYPVAPYYQRDTLTIAVSQIVAHLDPQESATSTPHPKARALEAV